MQILTQRGLFSINILHGAVYFEPIKCEFCHNHSSENRNDSPKNSLCIISDYNGWSNVGLEKQTLLILAKIFAIAQDCLPPRVLKQIHNICHGYKEYDELVTPQITPSNSEIELQVRPNESISSQPPFHISLAEAHTLLRNCRIKFQTGELPYSALKEKYELIINTI